MGDTAKIYDLTALRRERATRRIEARADEPVKHTPASIPGGGAWYHEAAIRDADRPRTH